MNWRHRLPRCLCLLLLCLPLTAAGPTERRIALVIGINAYQHAPHLTNPVNDARAIGDSLRRLNFEVTELYDPDLHALSEGIRDFGIRAANADVATVYYAGHGVQVDRENYLIPADARLEREHDLLYEAFPLDRLLGEVSQAKKIGIVLLDSCRNNPFIQRVARSMLVVGRSVSTLPGMARVDNVPPNTVVVMAAKADQIAEDGQGHSPFAAALLAHFQIPGLELSLFFRSVRDTVLRATSNRQEPYVFSSLGAEPFYFHPRPPNQPPQIAAFKPLVVTDAAGPTPLGMPDPADPDQDPLTVRIIGLPRGGEVRADGRVLQQNMVLSVDQFHGATYKPDGKSLGPMGTLDILIDDGRGATITASLPIEVRSSHHPPVVGGPGRVSIAQQALGIAAPVSPDGDPLTVTIAEVPRGVIRNGNAVLHVGDRLTPQELAKLTFTPEAGFTGSAGRLGYSVDNGHGDVVQSSVEIDVTSAGATDASADAGIWETVRHSRDPAEVEAFLRLFPHSRYFAAAQQHFLMLSEGNAAKPASATGPAPPLAPPLAPPPSAPPAVAAPPPPTVAAQAPPATAPPTMHDKPAVVAMATPGPNLPNASRVIPSTAGPLLTVPPPGIAVGAHAFRDCPTCPVMVRIPAGTFIMGEGAHVPEASPPHRVSIRAFALGATPVTVFDWRRCMAAQACKFLPRMHVSDASTPVHNLSWDDVGQYLTWLSQTSGHTYRLPSESEWEYAARGGTASRYWWGENAGIAKADCADCGVHRSAYGPLPVDAFPPNAFGLYDMLGGVAQWTADCWFPNYRDAPADGSPREARSCMKRVLRGGSFGESHDNITVTSRGNYDAPVRYLANGFRVARDLDPAGK